MTKEYIQHNWYYVNDLKAAVPYYYACTNCDQTLTSITSPVDLLNHMPGCVETTEINLTSQVVEESAGESEEVSQPSIPESGISLEQLPYYHGPTSTN